MTSAERGPGEKHLKVDVLYLRIIEAEDGFRWEVKQFGRTEPMDADYKPVASAALARQAGRVVLMKHASYEARAGKRMINGARFVTGPTG